MKLGLCIDSFAHTHSHTPSPNAASPYSTRHDTIGEAPPHYPACIPARCSALRSSQALFRSEPRARARFSWADLHIPNVHVLAAFCSAVVSPTTARIFLMPSVVGGYRSRGICSGRAAARTRSRVVQGRAQVALLMVTLGQSRLGVPDEPLRCQITVVVPADATRRHSRWLSTRGRTRGREARTLPVV